MGIFTILLIAGFLNQHQHDEAEVRSLCLRLQPWGFLRWCRDVWDGSTGYCGIQRWGLGGWRILVEQRFKNPSDLLKWMVVHIFKNSLVIHWFKHVATLLETNIVFAKRPSQKETSLPTIYFQVRNVSFREGRRFIRGVLNSFAKGKISKSWFFHHLRWLPTSVAQKLSQRRWISKSVQTFCLLIRIIQKRVTANCLVLPFESCHWKVL